MDGFSGTQGALKQTGRLEPAQVCYELQADEHGFPADILQTRIALALSLSSVVQRAAGHLYHTMESCMEKSLQV